MLIKKIATGFLFKQLERKYEKSFRDQHRDLQMLFAQALELLDHDWYCKKYLSLAPFKKTTASLHYLFTGIDKDLNPNKLVDFKYYNKIKTNRKLRSYSDCAVFDFLLRPNSSFVDPSPNFDGKRYLNIHSDVKLAEMNPFVHYFLNGKKERRAVSKSKTSDLAIDEFIQDPSNFIQQKSCLIIAIDSTDDLNQLQNIGTFEKVILLSKIKINRTAHPILNQENCITISESDLEKELKKLYSEIEDFDIVCKINLSKRLIENNKESKLIEQLICKIDMDSLLNNQHQIETVFAYDGKRPIGILGPWSFYYGALEIIKNDLTLYQQYCDTSEVEVNWNFFASGSYYFRPILLKTVIENYSLFDDPELSISGQTYKISTIDFLIARANRANGFDQSIVYRTDLDNKNTKVKHVENRMQFRYRIKLPFQNLKSQLTLDQDYQKLKDLDLLNAAFYEEDNPTSFNMDSFLHYLRYGVFMGLNPSPEFDSELYSTEYLEDINWVNPLVHYISNNKNNRIFPIRGNVDASVEAIEKSGLFDEEFYLQHVEFANVKPKNALRHYCEYGWKVDMSPSPIFDEFDYTQKYLTKNKRHYNPLLHYVLKTQSDTVINNVEAKIPKSNGVILSNKPVKRICLFAGFDKDGIVDDYVVAYISELSKYADVFYLAACLILDEELDKLNEITVGRWAIKHGDYDFGSYQRLANHLVGWDTISKYDELMLVNDSSYLVRPLDQVFEKMNRESCDWWGLEATKGMYKNRERSSTEILEPIPILEVKKSYLSEFDKQPNYDFFLGSYFLVFRKPVIAFDRFKNYLNNVSNQSSKELLIIRYEIGLNRMLMKSGFEFGTFIDDLYPFHPLFSMNHFNLIGKGFPLFKRYLLSANHYKVEGLYNWESMLKAQSEHADTKSITDNILRVVNYTKYYNNIHLDIENPLLSNEEFCELDAITEKKDHYWAFPVCAYDHGLNGNLRAVFELIKDDPSIKKIILCRKKIVQYGGTNVEVVPLMSRAGQAYLLQSKVVFFKHSRFRNVRFSISGHDRMLINLWHGIPLKRIGTESLDQQHNLENLIADNSVLTSVIASSKIDAANMHRAFKPLTEDQIWTTGLPRNDFLLKEESVLPLDMIEQLNTLDTLLDGKKLILFVPTFRNSQEVFNFTSEALDRLNTILKQHNAVIGVRDHFASKRKYIEQFKHIDAISLAGAKYKDVEMLYRKADVLLTDYSSCYIDYLLLDKPVISFAYDLESYATSERGLYFELKEVFPGYICGNVNELLDSIENSLRGGGFDFTEKYKKVKDVFHQFKDGMNTKRLFDKIKEDI